MHVIGSADLAPTLLADQLFDELRLWVNPMVLGERKKLFPDGAQPGHLRLLDPVIAGDGGTLGLRYAPLPGEPATGSFGWGCPAH